MKHLTYGMVGGGPGAFIGDAHRRAISLDQSASLVAGCFSSDPEKSKELGKNLGIDPVRCYDNYWEMAEKESQREDGIDFVVIVTPNSTHYHIAKKFLESGIHVSCDKPVVINLKQAQDLQKIAFEQRRLFMVTYTYTGHLTIKFIRELIKAGEIGEIRTVMAEYPQGWLYNEKNCGGKQGSWRCDPEQSGRVNCLGDLGTHVENLVSMMTGLKIRKLLAKMDVVVPGRVLDDNDQILVEYDNGATGMYWTSQFAIGCDNSLRIRIFGSKGSIYWFQEEPEQIVFIGEDGVQKIMKRGYPVIPEQVSKYARLPSGHTEGWLEAMGNLYISFTDCIQAQKKGHFDDLMIDFQTIDAGVEGLEFIEACLKSNDSGNVWVNL